MKFYYFARRLVYFTFFFIFKLNVYGIENIPKNGKSVICSNHASMLDPVFLGLSIKRQIFFMTKKEMFKNKPLSFILKKLGTIPVDREGADLSAVKKSIKILRQENILGIFPEGTRVKQMSLDNAKPGIGMICIKGKSPVIPVYIDSDYKFFSKVNVYIGNSIDFSSLYTQKLSVEEYTNISKTILEKIYELKK